MVLGYVREVKKEGLGESLEMQKQELLKLNDKVDDIFAEYGSGLDVNRTQLNKMLENVTDGDTIVVTDISRLTRSRHQLENIIKLIKKKKVKLQLGDTTINYADID